ncbi:hypothetical protein CMI47_19180 [Candidatus Pacearchaeota archaeon]|nr:hypothetical protein [Candidatus Pacearchaeota archaeon]|tara:strand:+ start:8376 stop:8702 length:327 start_codon:yes stop_codon:yes gene_type:complete
MGNREINSGDIVIIKTDRSLDGFSTGPHVKGGLKIYKRIDLSNYPSHNDFFGSSVTVKSGDIATVISYIGRPDRLSSAEQWKIYDVYEILVKGNVYQMFRQNIKLSKK